jgi:predicted transport protein
MEKNNHLVESAEKTKVELDLKHTYILDEEEIKLQAIEHLIINREKYAPIEKKFNSAWDMEQILLNNTGLLFGNSVLIIEIEESTDTLFPFFLKGSKLLLDFRNIEQPGIFWIVAGGLTPSIPNNHFMFLSHFFFFQRNPEELQVFLNNLIDWIISEKTIYESICTIVGEESWEDLLGKMIRMRFQVLLLSEKLHDDFSILVSIYPDTWGKNIKLLQFKKIAVNGTTLCSVIPHSFQPSGKKEKNNRKESFTEQYYLDTMSASVKEIYLKIKESLLAVASNDLEFSAKKYYIALRKNRNVAFFQPGRKKLSIVVSNPHKNSQKHFKHHEVRKLADSVKRFWNGNDYCFTVVIDKNEHLEEVTSLLISLINQEDGIDDLPEPKSNPTKNTDKGKKKSPEVVAKRKKAKTKLKA